MDCTEYGVPMASMRANGTELYYEIVEAGRRFC
jgi:hypothetical protein